MTPEIVTLSENAAGSATVNPSRVVAPSTSRFVETLTAPVTSTPAPTSRLPATSTVPPDFMDNLLAFPFVVT